MDEGFRRFTVKLGGVPVKVALGDCRVCLGGEFAGNVRVRLDGDVALAERLAPRLAFRAPGLAEDLELVGWGVDAGSVELELGSTALAERAERPAHVVVSCDGREVAELPCRLWGCRPFDPTRLEDPQVILHGTRVPSRRRRHRGVWRGPILSGGVAAAFAGAAALGASGLVGGAAVLALVGLLLVALARIPYEQLEIDSVRGTLVAVRGRWAFLGFREIGRREWRLSEFSHVRIVDRFEESVDHVQETVWILSFEGPLRWQDDHGDVHWRSDSVHWCECSSHAVAVAEAAFVARDAGLRVLDTSQDARAGV